MRPIRLDLTNFTIFRGRHSIDFSGLRFFIIQGKTGSGKTSIIDAMCYALYGRVPRHGKENLSDNITSKGTDHLNVFFEFSVRGKRYAVERFVRRNKSGARFYEDGIPKDLKLSEISETIKEILGVDYETFTKVILLPQGQFDSFLKPERPQQRREILNKLLGMDILLQKLNDIIKETKRQVENELTQVETALKELSYATKEELERIEKEMEAVEIKLSALNKEKEELQERLKTAIERDNIKRELLECERELGALLEKRHQMERLEKDIEIMEEASSYAPYLENFRRLSSREEEEKKAIKELEVKIRKTAHEKELILKEMKIYEKDWNNIGEYDTRIEILTRETERVKSALEKIKERDRKLQDFEQTTEHLRRIEQNIQNLEDRISRGEKFVKEKEAHIEELEVKQKRFLELTPIKSKLDDVKRERQTLKKILDENRTLEGYLQEVRERIRQKEEELLGFSLYHIRSRLKQGDVCPVCGNKVSQVSIEEFHGDVEQIKKDLEKLKDRERNLSEKKLRIDNIVLSLRQKEEELIDLLDGRQEYEFEMEYEELEKAHVRLDEERKTLKSAKDKLEGLKEELNKNKNDFSLNKAKSEKLQGEILEIEDYLTKAGLTGLTENDLKTLEKELMSLKEKREEIRKRYTELSDRLRMIELEEQKQQTEFTQREKNIDNIKEDKSKLSKNLEPAIKRFGSLKDLERYIKPKEHIRELKNQIEDYNKRISILTQRRGQLTEGLKVFSDIEPTEEIKQRMRHIEDEQRKSNIELGHIKEQRSRVEEGIKRREELTKRQKELEHKEWVYSSLDKDLRGDKLQEFISQIMLQKIVGRANFYMQKFTSGAYEYELENSDIMIVDRMSGHKRNVSTLSGGETFLASLSLAFGISDVISHNAPIESLFIDEGFGSLDRETREELSHFFEIIKLNTDRVVGIISHLEDLAERFDQRIEVIRRGDRSFINVII